MALICISLMISNAEHLFICWPFILSLEKCLFKFSDHSAIRKNEILLFVTTWMDLESIMLSEISQRKTNTI